MCKFLEFHASYVSDDVMHLCQSQGVSMVSEEFVAEQLKSVLSDMHVDVVSLKCCLAFNGSRDSNVPFIICGDDNS